MGTDDADTIASDEVLQGARDDAGVQIVEAGGWFIQEQHERILDEGAGDGSALLLATGKRLRQAFGILFKTEQTQPAVRVCVDLFGGQARETGGESQIALDRGERQQVQLLKNEAEFATLETGVGWGRA